MNDIQLARLKRIEERLNEGGRKWISLSPARGSATPSQKTDDYLSALEAYLDGRVRKLTPFNDSQRKQFQSCEVCAHFKRIEGDDFEVPDNYNPCELKHKMLFRVPEFEYDCESGYYQNDCKDRVVNEQETSM